MHNQPISESTPDQTKSTTVTLQLTPAEWVLLACAGYIGLGFFLPTIYWMFGAKVSLCDLAQHGEGLKYKILWLLPLLAAGTVFQIILRKHAKVLGQVAGAMSFVPLVWNLVEHGQDVMKLLMPTAYLYLLCGVILFVISPRIKTTPGGVAIDVTKPQP